MQKSILSIEKYKDQYNSLVNILRSRGKNEAFIHAAIVHAVINNISTSLEGEELMTFLQHLDWMFRSQYS